MINSKNEIIENRKELLHFIKKHDKIKCVIKRDKNKDNTNKKSL